MARRPKRFKGVAYDRAKGEWSVYQYSVDSDNPERRDKAQAGWDSIAKMEDDPPYFLRELIRQERTQGYSEVEAKNRIAKKLGVTRTTVNRNLRKPSINIQQRALREYQRRDAGKKGYRGREYKKALRKPFDGERPVNRFELPPIMPAPGEYLRQWSMNIPGRLTRNALKDVLITFTVGVIGEGASMIVSTVTQRMDTPGLGPSPPKEYEVDTTKKKIGYKPRQEGAKTVRYSSGDKGEGYDPATFLFRIDEIVEMIANQPDIVNINIYARE